MKIKYCETCGEEHDGSYGSGRFCCQECARSFSSKHVTEDGRKRQKEALLNEENRNKALDSWKTKCNFKKDSDGNWIKPKDPDKHKVKPKNNHKLHSLAKGKVGELATAIKFINHDYNVFVPLVDSRGTDMIVEKNGDMKKIQVKSAASVDDNVTHFSLRSSDFNMKNGVVISHNKKYSKKDADYFALYSEKDDDVYLIENDEKRTSFTIRNKISDDNIFTRGKVLDRVHMAEDYQIDKVLNDIDKGINQSDIIDAEFEELSDN